MGINFLKIENLYIRIEYYMQKNNIYVYLVTTLFKHILLNRLAKATTDRNEIEKLISL